MASLFLRRLGPNPSPATCKLKLMTPVFPSSSSANGFHFNSVPPAMDPPPPPPPPQSLPSSSSSVSVPSLCRLRGFSKKRTSPIVSSDILRLLNTRASGETEDEIEAQDHDAEESEDAYEWEEEDETEPELGDGGDGGGVVLNNVPWGDRVLSIAREVLLQFDDDLKLFAFKTTPRGYIYVRLDKLPEKYGCPSLEEIENYNQQYKKRLDEVGAQGDIPDNLAIEISSPGATRILKVPDDLDRFKNMPMTVSYVEDVESKLMEKGGVFLLDSVDLESEACIWKLANVKENRDPLSKGRPLSRTKRDWRLNLPYAACKKVILYFG